jgi:hypothetical protein
VFLYTLPNDPAVLSQNYYDEFVSHNHYITTNPTEACIYVAIMDSNLSLENLSYFGSNGKNHLLIDVYGKYEPKMVDGAMLVSNRLSSKNYRLESPKYVNKNGFSEKQWTLPSICPYRIQIEIVGED